jgi:hypothetical protein
MMMKKENMINKKLMKFGIPIVFILVLNWIHSQNCVEVGTYPLLSIFTTLGAMGITANLLRSFKIGTKSMTLTVMTNGMLLIPVYLIFSMLNKIPVFDFTGQQIMIIALVIVTVASIKAYTEMKSS